MQNKILPLMRVVALPVLFLLLGAQSNFVSIAEAGCKDAAEPGVDWTNCRKRNLILQGSNLEKSELSGADLSSTDLRESNFTGANLNKTNMMRSTIEGSTATGANFEHVLSYRTNFKYTEFTDANFNKAEMQRANFSNSILVNASFIKADLGRAIFDDATLKDNNFERANLSRVNFSKAKLSGTFEIKNAYLLQTNIEGVDFSGAIGMEQWQVNMACGNDQTILPDGLTKPESWPCVFDQDE